MSIPALSSDDLIEDRAVSSLNADRFHHADFVAELADLARQVPTPANVALYAPWGSGKTGLANLLAAEFKDDDAVRFVRFDALKYAETPMRRQFLSQLARALKLTDSKYSVRLYRAETTNNFTVPGKAVAWFAAAFAGVLAIALAAASLVGLLYAFFGPSAYWHNFRTEWTWAAPRAFVPATLLAVVAALAGKRFTVERRTDIPSSEEQFEDTFVDLVNDAVGVGIPKRVKDEKKRLVVFVDELDRCSPPAVASVLETLRTFLEVRGCVFIVAADQQGLEAALSHRVKQATPSNSVSPYYSAGNAYLDKVFQYQLSLPALKPQRLTTYALGLVTGRGGLWTRVRAGTDLDEVVSVLVPTHVQSPRRVKALLNNFALLYRLAERRADEGILAGTVVERASELAKLACLRLEFPLFAADLVLDPRMPALVSELADDAEAELPATVTPEVAERAHEWAKRERAVAGYLTPVHSRPRAFESTSDQDGEDVDQVEDGRAAAPEEEFSVVLVPDDAKEGNAIASRLSAEAADAVQREHSAQLLRYLKRTRAVPGPGRDLLYLESAGASLGVSFDGADQLEWAAVDGDTPGVLAVIEALGETDQLAAFRVLAYTVRHTAVGLEAKNVVATLLSSLSVRSSSLGTSIADEIALAISAHDYDLTPDQLPGAFELSLESSHSVGAELRERIISTPEALTNTRVCVGVIKAAETMFDEHSNALATAVARLAHEEPSAFTDALDVLSDDTASRALSIAASEVARMTARDEEDMKEERGRLLASLDGLLDQGRPRLAEEYAALLLRISVGGFTSALMQRFDRLVPTTTPALSRAMTVGLTRYPRISDARRWVDAVTLPLLGDAVDGVTSKLGSWAAYEWGQTIHAGRAVAPMNDFAEGLRRYANAGLIAEASDELEEAIESALASPFSDADELHRKDELTDLAFALVAADLVVPSVVSDAVLKSIIMTLTAAQSRPGSPAQRRPVAQFGPHAVRLAEKAIARASDESLERMRSMTGTIWDGERQAMSMMAAAELAARGEEVEPPYGPSELAGLVRNMPAFALGLKAWFAGFDPGADSIVQVLRPIAASELHPEVQMALRAESNDKVGSAEHLELVNAVLESAMYQPVTNGFYRAIRLRDAPAKVVADLIVELYEINPDEPHVRELLKAWTELAPTDTTAQRRLLGGFFIPAAKGDEPGIFALLLDYLGLLRGVPSDRRAAARDALRRTAERLGRSEDLERLLEAEGFKTSGRILRRPKDV